MKKIMIIGKLNSTTKEIYNGLAQYSVLPFQVQVCVNKMEWIKPMMQMIEPDFVIMSLNGVEKMDVQIAAELQINYVWTPVLCCGTEMELVPFQKFMSTKQFERLQRPFEVEHIIGRLKELLKLEGPDIPTVTELMDYSQTANAVQDYAPQDPDWNIDFDQSEIDKRIAEALQRKQKEQEEWIRQAQQPKETARPQEQAAPAPKAEPRKEAPAPKEEKKERLHILLVDDNAIQLRTLRSFLVKDYDVSLAVSGDDAMVQLEKHRPDLVFLDYEMPGSNGRDVLARIRQLEWAKYLPVVFLTGLRDKEKIRELVALKPAGYMLKPAEADAVKQMIKKILG